MGKIQGAKRLGLTAILGLSVAAFTVTPASADPVLVTSGTYSVHYERPSWFTFIGDGFTLSGDAAIVGVGPVMDCPTCNAGGRVNMGADVPLPDWFDNPGTAAFGTTTFPSVFYSGALTFTAPTVTMPPFTGSSERSMGPSLVEPFSFTGQLTGFATAARDTTPLFTTSLTGAGTVTFRPFSHPATASRPWNYEFGAVDYVFSTGASPSPTPEPATLFLLGSGIIAVARRFRAV